MMGSVALAFLVRYGYVLLNGLKQERYDHLRFQVFLHNYKV